MALLVGTNVTVSPTSTQPNPGSNTHAAFGAVVHHFHFMVRRLGDRRHGNGCEHDQGDLGERCIVFSG